MSTPTIDIQALGPKGDGIHEGPRGRVYVERAVPGDQLRARIRRDEQGVARGEILEIIEPSEWRQPAPCPNYERCGNCTLQHVQEGFYRDWKLAVVSEALRNKGLKPLHWLSPVFITGPRRRRATFSACKSQGKVLLGYYRRRSQQITNINECLVADPRLLSLRDAIKPFLGPLLKEGQAVDVFFQLVADAVDMLITGPIGRRGRPDATVVETLSALASVASITRISWRGHERDDIQSLLGAGQVVASFGSLQVPLPPAAFLQPTLEGEQALVAAVMAALPSEGKFADLFSGCGTFTGPMLERGPVDAYESVPRAVSALAKAAPDKSLRVFRRDLFLEPLRREEINRYDAVVFDPPRAGASAQTAAMASAKVPLLVGVSCNPATFARDARTLVDSGYRLASVQVVDQFLWSHHVEVVGVFTKKR